MLNISTDGFQMANSSKRCGWPIFVSIEGTSYDPCLVGLKSIKSVDEFMKYFCEELGQLRENGGLSVPDPKLPNTTILVPIEI